jgi:hypothetical protein
MLRASLYLLPLQLITETAIGYLGTTLEVELLVLTSTPDQLSY